MCEIFINDPRPFASSLRAWPQSQSDANRHACKRLAAILTLRQARLQPTTLWRLTADVIRVRSPIVRAAALIHAPWANRRSWPAYGLHIAWPGQHTPWVNGKNQRT